MPSETRKIYPRVILGQVSVKKKAGSFRRKAGLSYAIFAGVFFQNSISASSIRATTTRPRTAYVRFWLARPETPFETSVGVAVALFTVNVV